MVTHCAVLFLMFGFIDCLRTVPERALVVYNDTNEYEYTRFFVSRYGRRSDYYINYEANVIHPQYNNVTLHLVFYEFLHNEYRRSFVEMKFKLCDILDKEAYVGGMLKQFGLRCPVFGDIHMVNMTIPMEQSRYVMPFTKFRVDLLINKTEGGLNIFHGMIWAHFARK